VARAWSERHERRREDREMEKAGLWRCEDRGYYLSPVNEGGGVREPGLPDQVAVGKNRRAA
jgi:hypothetical protein